MFIGQSKVGRNWTKVTPSIMERGTWRGGGDKLMISWQEETMAEGGKHFVASLEP
jgi:hypothetical protein